MKTSIRAALITATAVALVSGSGTAANAVETGAAATSGAVFVETDGLSNNSVVAYDRHDDGTLAQAGVYDTGGTGTQLGGAQVDFTASQSSLIRHGDALFAVNAGSGTVTSFAVAGDRLTRRQVVSSGGTTPVSIAAHGNRVFVLNAGDGGSVQGFLNLGGRLIPIPAWHRELGLDTSGTPQFTHTPAEIAFSPDGSKLVVSTKAASNAFEVLAVGPQGLSAPVTTVVPGSVPFGFQFDQYGRIVVAEAGINAVATFSINADGSVSKVSEQFTGQHGTCWLSVVGGQVYASNAGSADISALSLNDNGGLQLEGTTPTDPGTVDSAATPDGRFLYVQTGASGAVDEFAIQSGGQLTRIGSVVVPGAVGAEGITAN